MFLPVAHALTMHKLKHVVLDVIHLETVNPRVSTRALFLNLGEDGGVTYSRKALNQEEGCLIGEGGAYLICFPNM